MDKWGELMGKFFLAILFLVSINAHAESVWERGFDTRTELPESVFGERKVWGVDLAFGYNEFSGNVEQKSKSGRLALFRTQGERSVYLDGSLLYSRSGQRIVQNRKYGALRGDWRRSENFKWFAFNTHAESDFLKLDYRTTVGAGPWYDFSGKSWKNGISVAPTYYYEEYANLAKHEEGGLSLRNHFAGKLNEVSSVGVDFFFAPRFKSMADYHAYFEPFFNTKLYHGFVSLKLSYTLEYDSRPQPGINAADRAYMTSLNFAMGE